MKWYNHEPFIVKRTDFNDPSSMLLSERRDINDIKGKM